MMMFAAHGKLFIAYPAAPAQQQQHLSRSQPWELFAGELFILIIHYASRLAAPSVYLFTFIASHADSLVTIGGRRGFVALLCVPILANVGQYDRCCALPD